MEFDARVSQQRKNEMKSESFEILKELLNDFVEDVVTRVLDKRQAQEVNVVEKLDEIKILLKRQQVSLGLSASDDDEEEDLIFSFWHKKDVVYMSDKRLYDRKKFPNCPFRSRSALQRIKDKNPCLFFKNEQGVFVAVAEDLFDYICNKKARDLAAGKGMRINNKRN